nr:MAG TPA: hypothetical protein [Caudoviricetes sp.]
MYNFTNSFCILPSFLKSSRSKLITHVFFAQLL